jgi:hypothetical protein
MMGMKNGLLITAPRVMDDRKIRHASIQKWLSVVYILQWSL